MAWHRPGTKPLSEAMLVRLPTHICVTRPQWVTLPMLRSEYSGITRSKLWQLMIWFLVSLGYQQPSCRINAPLWLYHPKNKVVGGYIGFTLSLPPSRIPCPLCSSYSSCWIHFIFIHLIKQLRRCVACKVSCKISKFDFCGNWQLYLRTQAF